MMLKSVLLFVFLLIFYKSAYVNGATFENVSVILVEDDRVSTANLSEHVRKPTILIESDDSLVPYTKNRGNYTVVRIEIDHQNIPKLPIRSIYNIWIYGLSITHCNLEEIEPEAFSMVPVLRTLDLSFNKLEIIKNGVFSGLGIHKLFLASNKIVTIENKAFVNMKLKTIDLSNNRISSWDNEWFADTPVSSLYMSYNLIQELPSNAFVFQKRGGYDWYEIDFQNNQIKTIQPNAFYDIGTISVVNLKNNQIEELVSEAFTGITKVVFSLHLENNKISKVHVKVFGLTNQKRHIQSIEEVNLENNQLSEVPWQFLIDEKIVNMVLKNNPLNCSFTEEAEYWASKAGDNFHGYQSVYKYVKENCV